MATSDFQFFRGDTWPMQVNYTAAGHPYDLTGAIYGADLYIKGLVQPFAVLALGTGDAAPIDLTTGAVVFTLDENRSINVQADSVDLDAATPDEYPTRLVPWVVDTLGVRRTAAIQTINVLDRRFSTQADIVQFAVAAISDRQGPSGPAVSVNGHTGAVQTLTATDVGAYTTAQADAAVLTATQAVITTTATTAIGGHKVAKIDGSGVSPASSANVGDANLVLGITLGAAAQGAPAQVQTHHLITEPSWSWSPGPVFLGTAGALTQTPPTTGLYQQVGIAMSATTLLVDIQDPIIRA